MQSNTQVIAAVVEKNGKFLVCQRPPHKRHGGLWEFPGGKLEPGETIEDGARRELAEELGLTLTFAGLIRFAAVDPASGFTINFLDVETEGEPTLHEHTAFVWANTKQLLELNLAPSDRQYVEFLNSKVNG